MLSSKAIGELNDSFQDLQPKEILKQVFERLPGALISFSGAEDVLLIELASKLALPLQVFTLDTGRLHPQTYRFIERIRSHYDLPIEMLYPDSEQLEIFIKSKGLYSFYDDGHEQCCEIRKVAPLRRKLSGVDAW
ncbi:MAG TPA: phosphoadenosine phosphosulfate reductase, partial [Gammaproteobacteria bacterium]|nr:phosphoadenosine phosphosulfate reductase [Gammaproteobacteria bacterium]